MQTVEEDGKIITLELGFPDFRKQTSKFDATLIWHAVSSAKPEYQVQLRRALADFRAAINFPDDTPFFCFRAVEALKHSFPDQRREGFSGLCGSLNVSREFILQRLEKPAGAIRHGKVLRVSAEEREKSLSITAEVIERFIAYISKSDGRLSEQEYPPMI